jgi:hypothetical protein
MIRKPSNTRASHRDGPNSTRLHGFFLAQNRRRATSASSARRNTTCTIPYSYLFCRRVEKQPVNDEALNRGHRSPLFCGSRPDDSPRLYWPRRLLYPAKSGSARSRNLQYSVGFARPPNYLPSGASAGYRLRDRTPNLRRGPRSKLGALITLTGLSEA